MHGGQHVLADLHPLTSNGPLNSTFTVLQSDGVQQKNIKTELLDGPDQTFDYGEWSQRTITSSPIALGAGDHRPRPLTRNAPV